MTSEARDWGRQGARHLSASHKDADRIEVTDLYGSVRFGGWTRVSLIGRFASGKLVLTLAEQRYKLPLVDVGVIDSG